MFRFPYYFWRMCPCITHAGFVATESQTDVDDRGEDDVLVTGMNIPITIPFTVRLGWRHSAESGTCDTRIPGTRKLNTGIFR